MDYCMAILFIHCSNYIQKMGETVNIFMREKVIESHF